MLKNSHISENPDSDLTHLFYGRRRSIVQVRSVKHDCIHGVCYRHFESLETQP